jgi:hypothetical protein
MIHNRTTLALQTRVVLFFYYPKMAFRSASGVLMGFIS